MKQFSVPIAGMHCRSCELLLEDRIGKVSGVEKVQVSYAQGEAVISIGDRHPKKQDIHTAVQEAGYRVGFAAKSAWLTRHAHVYWDIGIAALLLLGLYFVARWTGLLDISVQTEKLSLPFAVVIGLVAGVSTCMAVVGGLVLGIAAQHAERNSEATPWQKFRPHVLFNVGRILGYAAFGALLGALGSVLKLSNGVLALLTVGVGVMMLFMGLKLTGISPRLKELSLTLPSSIGKRFGLSNAGGQSGSRSSFLTGALTFFLPCGFTQAMQLYAISTGSVGRGALVLALFAIGTAPALLSMGGLTSIVKGIFARRFYTTVGLAVLIFGFLNVRNGLTLTGLTSATIKGDTTISAEIIDGYQIVRMTQYASNYKPNKFTILKGVPVKWIITSESAFSCAASIRMPKYGIAVNLKEGENVVEFTPKETGTVPFSCSMGMYRGSFTVVDEGETTGTATSQTDSNPPAAAVPLSGSASCGGGGGCGGGGAAAKPKAPQGSGPTAEERFGVQKLTTRDASGPLDPSNFSVKVGVPVAWTVEADGPPVGCMNAFVSEELGIGVRQSQTGTTTIQFTPQQTGTFDVTCGMGMYRGSITVIN